ncbi:TPA: hypothetical protein DEB29_01575 [Candidatus Wolfebacteria bacterium]|nr:hypothetical protein [Candidatus Wolfebacteria bacterium]
MKYKEYIDLMDKTPMKKIRMMDIVRKKPTAAAPTSWKAKEEQVKFTIEKKPELHREEIVSAPKEDMRKSVVVETTPLHATSPQQVAREAILRDMKTAAVRERVELDVRAQRQEEERGYVPVVKEETPRVIETQAQERSAMYEREPRLDALPQTAYRPTQEVKMEERPMTIPEVSSLEMDRPIAYIPKEKPTREEKRVLERIEKRERSQKKEIIKVKKGGIFTWSVVSILLGLGAYLVVVVLPRAEIVLVPKTVTWPASDSYANVIGASTKIADIDPTAKQIPVAVFSEKKTNAFHYPATGSGKSIERKATGKITVYNEYNSSSQPLIAGTRFETPDGKIFRLKERIVVPGAKTDGGELVPASIEAEVVADKAGESYNISPVNKFTIPGFAGSEKFEKFYAESKKPMTGGFVGEGKYPTEKDIATAKEDARKQMKEVIESFLATQVVPEGFKVIESSRRFSISKETVNESVDEQGNFSIYIEAEGGVDTLKEEHVLKLMTALARQVNGDGYVIREHTLSYGDITVDEKTGMISLPIDFKGVFWKPINVEEFKKNAFGKDENELKSYIFSSSNIEKADVSLWPIWVKRVPSDPDRVKVELK